MCQLIHISVLGLSLISNKNKSEQIRERKYEVYDEMPFHYFLGHVRRLKFSLGSLCAQGPGADVQKCKRYEDCQLASYSNLDQHCRPNCFWLVHSLILLWACYILNIDSNMLFNGFDQGKRKPGEKPYMQKWIENSFLPHLQEWQTVQSQFNNISVQ